MVLSTAISLLLALLASPARAVTIEGFTPLGHFKTVGVSELGELKVISSTGTQQHVIVDTGSVTAFQGGTWTTTIGNVTIPGGLTVNASTSALTVANTAAVSGVAGVVYPADAARKQGALCNSGPDTDIWIGPASVAVGAGLKLHPGDCYGPDNPTAYIGALYGVSTAAATVSYIYHK
jgi:hypothetical protein